MTRLYYRDAVGCLIVYDLSRPSTFDAVTRWKVDLDTKAELPNGNRLPCLLLANKVHRYFFIPKSKSDGNIFSAI